MRVINLAHPQSVKGAGRYGAGHPADVGNMIA